MYLKTPQPTNPNSKTYSDLSAFGFLKIPVTKLEKLSKLIWAVLKNSSNFHMAEALSMSSSFSKVAMKNLRKCLTSSIICESSLKRWATAIYPEFTVYILGQ